MTACSFDLIGKAEPESPVVISVPHGGRDYPPALREALAAPMSAVAGLEDRYIDAVALTARTNETMLVQRLGRAWIDLNRSEDERDPRVDEGAPPLLDGEGTAKLRSGLGLVPRRAGSIADLWRGRFSDADIHARIMDAHRPYHEQLSSLLLAARHRWGIAILLDLHSMPSLGPGGARVVVGDLFGRAADGRFVGRVEQEATHFRLKTAVNAPYAGGHVLRRHAAPAVGIHAIQLEIDRSLYLDRRLDSPGPGLDQTARLVRQIVDALTDEALGALRHAAE